MVLRNNILLFYGTWQLVEVFSGPPSGDGWQKVEDGYIYEIRSDRSFRSTIASECETGTVKITFDKIIFNYDCEGFTMETEEPAGIFKYLYSLDNSMLQLDPLNINCFEGCAYRFEKIADEELKTD